MSVMTLTVPIGEFSRMSHLSVAALRHYQEAGVLAPVEVDAATGYRRYGVDQLGDAHLVRRLRDLAMPVPEVAVVVAAGPGPARDTAIRRHLERMERELAHTQDVVASLRVLLSRDGPPIRVSYRSEPPIEAAAVAARVARPDIGAWCQQAFSRLLGAVEPVAPPGATYADDFFAADEGEIVAYAPIHVGLHLPAGVARIELPAVRLALAVHEGPYAEIDRTYGALGRHVAEHDQPADQPIRETYLVGPSHTDRPETYRTEICWPIR
jgi:DNA-binding transcriptional MerR regulator